MDVRVTFQGWDHSPFLSRYLAMKLKDQGLPHINTVKIKVDIDQTQDNNTLVCMIEKDCQSFQFQESFSVNAKHAIDMILGRLGLYFRSLQLESSS